MIIRNLRRESRDGKVRLSADVIHETAPVPVFVIFYEVDERQEALLAQTYDPFLVAALLPAVLHRETRVLVEGEVAPLLVPGLQCVMAWHHAWFGARHAPIPIEAGVRATGLPKRTAAMYLSGGVDSMFTLRRNQLWYPVGHSHRVRHAILVNGFDVRRPDAFRLVSERIHALADETDISLLTVTSNVPVLDDDYAFWTRQFGGAAFCSVAHALAPALQHVWFSANTPISDLFPWSLHPATDTNYSSADVQIAQDGLEFSRLDKVKLLAEWDVARNLLRVCVRNPVDRINCGACEKCIRTQLELLIAGRLADASAFPNDDITAEQIRNVHIRSEAQFLDETDLIPSLRAVGRDELVDAIETNLREFRKWEAWHGGTRIRHRVARALRLRA